MKNIFRNHSINFVFWGLIILLFYSFNTSFSILMGGAKGNSALMLFSLVFVVLGYSHGKKRIRLRKDMYNVWWMLFLIIFLIRNYDLMHGALKPIVQMLVGVLLMFILGNDDKWIESFWKTLLFFTTAHLIAGLYLLVDKSTLLNKVVPLFHLENASSTYFYRRLMITIDSGYMTGLCNHYSTMGMYLAIGAIVFSFFLFYKSKKSRFGIILLSMMLIGLLLSGKRAHIIFTIICIGYIYLYYFIPKSVNKKLGIFFGIFIFIVILGIISSGSVIIKSSFSRITMLFNMEDGINDASSNRIEMFWIPALILFQSNPVIGIGWGRFKTDFLNYYSANRLNNAHNVYLQILCETGIIGFAICVPLLIYTAYQGLHLLKLTKTGGLDDKKRGLLGVFTGIEMFVLLYSLTGNPLYDAQMFFPYIISCAGVRAIYRTYKTNIVLEVKGVYL